VPVEVGGERPTVPSVTSSSPCWRLGEAFNARISQEILRCALKKHVRYLQEEKEDPLTAGTDVASVT
jgi:hypothetical protein